MIQTYNPLIIGHRGAKACEAENTLGSFRKALSMGCKMIEFDVHKCKSGELVVIHDATINRTTNGRGRISRLTLSEIKKFRCENNETIPTLQETLDAIGNNAAVNVEIKTVDCVEAVVDFFSERDITNVVFSSFKWNALKTVRKRLPKAAMGLLMESVSFTSPFKEAKILGCFSINPPSNLVSPSFMEQAKKGGLKVMVFGLKDEKDMEKCFKLKADGIFADNPEQAFEVFMGLTKP